MFILKVSNAILLIKKKKIMYTMMNTKDKKNADCFDH